jgi:hypothetical protein
MSIRTFASFACLYLAAAAAALGPVAVSRALAQTPPANPETWPLLPQRFESTGGGGWVIDEYRPVVQGSFCVTDFVAVSPDGQQRFANTVRFVASPLAGGTLCNDGRWRAKDGSAEGTTPLVVWIRDGVARRAP